MTAENFQGSKGATDYIQVM